MMKKMKKLAIWLTAGLLTVLAVFSAGVFWPLEAPAPGLNNQKSLFINVSVVDVVTGEVKPGQNILVEHGAIVAVGPNLSASDAHVIDGAGRFAVPGLFDMHAHSMKMAPLLAHPMFVAAGVTAVRDMGGCIGLEDAMVACATDKRGWDQAAREGSAVSPRYDRITSLAIDGGFEIPTALDQSWWVTDTATAEQRVLFDVGRGIDFLKPYSSLTEEAYLALAASAKENGIYLAGHKPFVVSAKTAIAAGQRSFEHAFLFIWDCFPGIDAYRATGSIRTAFTNEARSEMIEQHDPAQCADLHARMRAAGAVYVPTHTTRKLDAYAIDEAFRSDERLKYTPAPLRTMWLQDADGMAKKAGDGGEESYKAIYDFGLKQTGLADKAGVTILAGTDAPDSFVFPGLGLHDELEHLVLAGLSPLDALRAATLEPARFLGLEGEAGIIQAGARADIILLAANPIADISAVRTVDGVMLAGVYYDAAARAKLMKSVEHAANSWSMWPKFVWQTINSPITLRQFAD